MKETKRRQAGEVLVYVQCIKPDDKEEGTHVKSRTKKEEGNFFAKSSG